MRAEEAFLVTIHIVTRKGSGGFESFPSSKQLQVTYASRPISIILSTFAAHILQSALM